MAQPVEGQKDATFTFGIENIKQVYKRAKKDSLMEETWSKTKEAFKTSINSQFVFFLTCFL